VPKQLLLLIGGLTLASVLVVAALVAFLVPPDVFEPSTEDLAEEQEAAEAEAEAEDDGEGEGEDDEGLGEADDPQEGTATTDEDAADDAPGMGDEDGEADGAAEPGGEDTGDVADTETADDA
jgi:hypothetical protein